ncbi:MAG: hypothetical protein GF331_05915 [Chitinivibrionales bacterium]|nr:hypothetical protein [Chitinivibrionales bacterium]
MLNFHPHVHAIAAEGAFTGDGRFVPMPHVCMLHAERLWRKRVFALLLETFKIDEQTVVSMRGWRHSGSSVNASVRIAQGDHEGMSRLVG